MEFLYEWEFFIDLMGFAEDGNKHKADRGGLFIDFFPLCSFLQITCLNLYMIIVEVKTWSYLYPKQVVA